MGSDGVRAVILAPRRAGVPERDRAWAWCRARWEALLPDVALYEGDHDDGGPFNRAAALNRAAAAADADGRWDLAVIVDADVFIDPANVRHALERARATGKVTWAFTRWNGLTPEGTERVLAGDPTRDANPKAHDGVTLLAGEPRSVLPSDVIEKTNPISWSCCFVVPRAVWDDIGGFDERFRGWGWEDMAFQSVVCGLYGHERLHGDVWHLWHPRAEERIKPGRPEHPAYVANRMLGRRYMFALRELGLHDRPVPSDEAEMERDRQNIRRLADNEERDHAGRPRPGMPDWSTWWPSLEELRDAAREGRTPGPTPRLAIILRSGGQDYAWPARRGYLERSIESLAANVVYEPTVARVVFSDWAPRFRPELEAIAGRHGFYVVGDGNRGFTAAMRGLWRYANTRPWGYEYAFVTEDDFEIERPVPVDAMMRTLALNQHLLQVALLRDAFYEAERERGGILGHPSEEFLARSEAGATWLEHRRFFTLNPTLVRRSIFARPWPTARHSEAVFGRDAFRMNRFARSALWGSGETWVRHLGEIRAGVGY